MAYKGGLAEWDVLRGRLNTHTHAWRVARGSGTGWQVSDERSREDGPGDLTALPIREQLARGPYAGIAKGLRRPTLGALARTAGGAAIITRRRKASIKDDELLIATAERQDELFSSDDGRAYVTFTDNGKSYTLLVEEEDYQDFLRRLFGATYGRPVESTRMSNAIKHLRAIAKAGQKYKVKVRLAGHEGAIYIDLCNDMGQAVEVTANGYRVVDKPPVRFRRTALMAPLPEPKPGTIALLRHFCHVADEDWPLIVGWLVAALRPEGPYTVLSMEGRPGAAKTTMARVCKQLVDPCTADLNAEPNNVEDLMLASIQVVGGRLRQPIEVGPANERCALPSPSTSGCDNSPQAVYTRRSDAFQRQEPGRAFFGQRRSDRQGLS